MGNAIFDVDSRLDGERPEPRAEVGVNEHSSGHRCKGKIAMFGDTVLWGRVRNGSFVYDSCRFSVGCECPFDEFRGIVDTKNFDTLAGKRLGGGTKKGKIV